MTALKLIGGKDRMESYKQAQLNALDAKEAADELRLKSLKEKYTALGREITDILYERMRRHVMRTKLERGQFIMPELEVGPEE